MLYICVFFYNAFIYGIDINLTEENISEITVK